MQTTHDAGNKFWFGVLSTEVAFLLCYILFLQYVFPRRKMSCFSLIILGYQLSFIFTPKMTWSTGSKMLTSFSEFDPHSDLGQCSSDFFHLRHTVICQRHLMAHQKISFHGKGEKAIHHYKYVCTYEYLPLKSAGLWKHNTCWMKLGDMNHCVCYKFYLWKIGFCLFVTITY